MEPPFFVQNLPGFLLVLVVTHHDVLAVHQDFARDVFGIGRVDLHLKEFRKETPAGTGLEFVVGSEADERSAFGHAVSNRDREFDTHQKCFGFHIHRCTAHDEDVHLSAERFHHLLADYRAQGGIQQRNLHSDTHRPLFEQRQYLFAIDFLENQGYAANDRGAHDLHGFDQDLRSGNFAQQGDVASDGQRREKVECTAVGVCQRQERERASAALEIVRAGLGVYGSSGEEHVARQVIDREHDAFRIAGRSRGVVEQDHPVVGNLVEADMLRSEPFRIGFAEVIFAVLLEIRQFLRIPALVDRVQVREREDGFDFPDLVGFDRVPERVAQEKQSAFRMVDDVDHVVGMEILQNGHDDRAVSDRGDVGDAPAGIVAADQRNSVALPDARLVEEQMQLGDLGAHFQVGEVLLLEIVGQCRQCIVLPEAGFVNINQVFA